MTGYVTKMTRTGRRHATLPRAFSLTELIVVVAIIVAVAAMAIPAIRPMLTSNKVAASVDALNGMLVIAQSKARMGDIVAIRFERALKTDPRTGCVVDAQGQFYEDGDFSEGPVKLGYQQARRVTLRGLTFQWDPTDKVQAFDSSVGLAPGYILNFPDLTDDGLKVPATIDRTSLRKGMMPVTYNLMDNFYVVFDRDGLVRYPYIITYEDLPWTLHANGRVIGTPYISINPDPNFDGDVDWKSPNVPEPSARSILLYDREKFLALPKDNTEARRQFLLREAKVCHISRVTGAIVEDVP